MIANDWTRAEAIEKYGESKLLEDGLMEFGPDSITVTLNDAVHAGPTLALTSALVFNGPVRVSALRAMDAAQGGVAKTAALISHLLNVPMVEINNMTSEDFARCGAALDFFM